MPASKTIVPIQIRFSDVDMAHHVHNAVYLHWFELARMALLRAFIPAGNDWKANGLILARNEVDYRLPIHLHDTIEAEVWCSGVGNKSFDLLYAIVRVTTGERTVCAEGRSVMVSFDYNVGRPIPVPPALRAALLAAVEA